MPSRERSRNEKTLRNGVWLLRNGETARTAGPWDVNHDFKTRIMTDVVGNPDHGMKPCSVHESSTTLDGLSGMLTFVDEAHSVTSIGGAWYVDNCIWYGYPSQDIIGPGITPDAITHNQLYRARAQIYSNFSPQGNLLASIAECASIKGLYTQIAERLTSLPKQLHKFKLSKSQRRSFERAAKKRGLTGSKKFLRDIASDYLAYSFGVLPLISDIKLIYQEVRRFSSKEVEPAYARYHGFNRVSVGSDVLKDVYFSNRNYHNAGYADHIRTAQAVISETSHVQWDTEELNTIGSRLKVTANRLGLHCLVGAMWEVVPFSFVADWFLPTKQIVDFIDNRAAYRPSFKLLDSCSSIGVTSKVESKVTRLVPAWYNPMVWSPNKVIMSGRSRGWNYNRVVPSSIPSWGLDEIPGLNGKRISYLTALIVQKRK